MEKLQATKVHTVSTVAEVQKEVHRFLREGYDQNHIYVLTYDKERTKMIVESTDAEMIGIAEEGLGTAIANIFRSNGSELRAKMRSLGIPRQEAERLEYEMSCGEIVIIAWGGNEYSDEEFDDDIYYHPFMLQSKHKNIM